MGKERAGEWREDMGLGAPCIMDTNNYVLHVSVSGIDLAKLIVIVSEYKVFHFCVNVCTCARDGHFVYIHVT